MTNPGTTIRMGLLGAARITPTAVIRPAADVGDVEVVAVAARDAVRARSFAERHGIERVLADYDELVEDPDVDAVYNALPNGLHGRWTIAALESGKHVLCEKPFAANAVEAREVAELAHNSGKVVMEAFHYRYHPMIKRALEVIHDGELGRIRRVEAWMCFPLLRRGDIRWHLDLAGGALMDAGCYALHQVRTFAGSEPRVTSARAKLLTPGVDRWFQADLSLPDGVTGQITASMLSGRLLSIGARVEGSSGVMRIHNPLAPHIRGKISIQTSTGSTVERAVSQPTYLFQLRAFAAAVREGRPFPTGVDDAVANMAAIDACYRAAGLEPRLPTVSA